MGENYMLDTTLILVVSITAVAIYTWIFYQIFGIGKFVPVSTEQAQQANTYAQAYPIHYF